MTATGIVTHGMKTTRAAATTIGAKQVKKVGVTPGDRRRRDRRQRDLRADRGAQCLEHRLRFPRRDLRQGVTQELSQASLLSGLYGSAPDPVDVGSGGRDPMRRHPTLEVAAGLEIRAERERLPQRRTFPRDPHHQFGRFAVTVDHEAEIDRVGFG